MPESSFRLDIAGSPIDFDLIGTLSKKYIVSKHACSNRVLQFTRTPVVIITCKEFHIHTLHYSHAATNYIKPLTQIPDGTLARKVIASHIPQTRFQPADPFLWLKREPVTGQLHECTHGDFTTGRFMTILRW